MKCVRCGYCCIKYDVIVIKDPSKPVSEKNVVHKPSNERCMHLRGDVPGQFSCAVHDHPDYEKTPCFAHGQTEYSPEDVCRIGGYVLKNPAVIRIVPVSI